MRILRSFDLITLCNITFTVNLREPVTPRICFYAFEDHPRRRVGSNVI